MFLKKRAKNNGNREMPKNSMNYSVIAKETGVNIPRRIDGHEQQKADADSTDSEAAIDN